MMKNRLAILLLHHEPKPSNGREPNDINALRGGTRLRTGVKSVLRLKEFRGCLALIHAKTNLGKEHAPIYLDLETPWTPEVVAEPKDKTAEKNAKLAMLTAIFEAEPERWFTLNDVMSAEGRPDVKKETIKKYLEALAEKETLIHNGERTQKAAYCLNPGRVDFDALLDSGEPFDVITGHPLNKAKK